MKQETRKYHIEITLDTLRKMKFPNPKTGDTRNYLDVDMNECEILIELLNNDLNAT